MSQCGTGSRRNFVGNRLRQRTEDKIDDARDGFQVGADRGRILSREHAALGHGEPERPERAAVDRHVGVDVLQRHRARRQSCVAGDIEGPAGLG